MSIQPLTNFSNDINLSNWHELIELAEILSTKYRLESLLTYFINLFERKYSIRAKLWLASSFSTIILNEGLENNASLMQLISPLMEEACHQKLMVPNFSSNPKDEDNPLILAVPLMVNDEVLGVVQLEKQNQVGFKLSDVEFVPGIISQFSLAISYLLGKSQSEYLQQYIYHLTLIEGINRSIISNLDRDSLLNSILSLIHQTFEYSLVNIYMILGEDRKILKRIGLSIDGIDPDNVYDYESEQGTIHWSMSHLQPVIINNPQLDHRFSTTEFSGEIRSKLIIPMLCSGVLMGILELGCDSLDAFGPYNINGFQLLAQNIAVAIRNANLYNSEHLSRLMNEHIHKRIGKISAEITLDDFFQGLLDELKEILPWDAAAIWLIDKSAIATDIDDDEPLLRLAAVRTKNQSFIQNDPDHSFGVDDLFDKYIQNTEDATDLLTAYPWISTIINSDTPVVRSSGSPYEPLGALLGYNHEYSAIGASLIDDEQPSGFIVLVHHQSNQYDLETQAVLTTFANYASVAIENTKIYTATHEQTWISTVLLQIAEVTQSSTNIDELLETVVSIIPGLIGVDACMIFLWDQSNETLYSQASYGFDAEQSERIKTWEIHTGSFQVFDKLKDSNNPIILNGDTLSDSVANQIFPQYHFDNDLLIMFPLFTQNSLCGALLIDFTKSALEIGSSQEIWDEKYTLIQGAARRIALAIENLQLIKSQAEEAYISVALLQVAQAIVSLNQLDEVLASIVRITPILVGVKRCIIYLWNNKDRVFRQSESYGFSKIEIDSLGKEIKANEFPFITAIQQNNQIIYHSVSGSNSPISWNAIAPGDYQLVEGINIDAQDTTSLEMESKSLINLDRLLIGFPLSIKGEILGVMLIEEEDHIKGFTSLHIREKRIEIVKGITQQAAIAIKNDLLLQDAVKSEWMERELQLAREIQTTFLPDRLPELPGWDISVKWKPAHQVGGDFYDIFLLDDDRMGFVIADVADKGMPAALFMTLIRTLIRAAAKEKLSPAAVLKQVNELLIPDSKHGMFVTVFYGVFSLNLGKLVYANAGHNPPIVKHIKRYELVELTRTTMALGIFNDIEIDERELSLKPGDWMLLYTDGVTEAFSVDEQMFGTDRLVKLLVDHEFISSKVLIETIEASVEDFIRGTDLSDDMTLAVIFRSVP